MSVKVYIFSFLETMLLQPYKAVAAAAGEYMHLTLRSCSFAQQPYVAKPQYVPCMVPHLCCMSEHSNMEEDHMSWILMQQPGRMPLHYTRLLQV